MVHFTNKRDKNQQNIKIKYFLVRGYTDMGVFYLAKDILI